jgi:hypothetical protein
LRLLIRLLPLKMLVVLFVAKDQSIANDRDYVPDEKTAVSIAEAVLAGQYGQESVNAQLPFYIVNMNKERWLIQGKNKDKEGRVQTKGAVDVWIDKHTGCLSVIRESKQNRRNYVPDKRTAMRIAEAVFVGQYGQERADDQLPLHAINGERWFVEGRNKDNEGKVIAGGPLSLRIDKKSGCISEDSNFSRNHREDYVPDEKTAVSIAEAVLVGQYGEESINAQLPLHVEIDNKDRWLIQGRNRDREGRVQFKGAIDVWIDRHTGCLSVIKESIAINRSYVPDERTALGIGKAVLVSYYGQERINAQLPLHVGIGYAKVEGTPRDKEGNVIPGRGDTVLINPQNGCLDIWFRR